MEHVPLLAAEFTDNAAEALTRAGIVLVVAIVVSVVAGSVIKRMVHGLVERPGLGETARQRAETRAQTLSSVLTAIVRAVIGTLGVLLILGEFGFDLAPLIAGAGIVGLAIGFGAQGLVSDFVSGLFMLAEDQYGVGDWVDVGETAGIVEHVGLRTTRIRSLDGLLWTVRNGEIVRTANANHGWGRAIVDIGVGYDADLQQVQELLLRVATSVTQEADHADKFLEAPEVWGTQELGDDAVTLRLVCKTQPGLQWGVARLLRLRLKEALDEEGVEIPFPQRTVWLRTEKDQLPEPISVAVDNDGSG